MNTRSSRVVLLFMAVIMILVAGCGSAGNTGSESAAARPGEPDITVGAIPAVDLVGLYIA